MGSYTPINMSSLLYIIAFLLFLGWVVGLFFYSVGGVIHILLVLAIISAMLRILGGKTI
jgi:hypothetical protein